MLKTKHLLLSFLMGISFEILTAQPLVTQPGIAVKEGILAQIDTGTVHLRSKIYPQICAGDLNIYGFEENDVPVYSDSAYAYRLSLLESEVPLDYNHYVRAYIELYTLRKRELVTRILGWNKYYFPLFEEVFDRENIPLEFKYLAVIESALNQNAVSCVGATGMWQFMAPTGRIYGLRTTNYLDERRDLIKSTEAAVKYFKDSYRIYKDWLLVIASYNCGAGNVNKAIRRSGGKRTFWEIMPYLPKETRGYVPAFIAAAYVMNYASEHNLYPAEVPVNCQLDTVWVDNRYSLEQLSMALNISIDDLKSHNPALRKGYIPFTSQKIVLTMPYQQAMRFAQLSNSNAGRQADEQLIAMNDEIEREKIADRKPLSKHKKVIYKVRRGDLLASIADKFNVSVSELKKWNKLRGSKIKKGQNLKVYPNRA